MGRPQPSYSRERSGLNGARAPSRPPFARNRLEGVVAKKHPSTYRSGQRGWVKKKNPNYWRRESEREAMQKAAEGRLARL